MSATSLARKLLIRPGGRVLVLNAPGGFVHALAPLPDGVEITTRAEGAYDVVQFFARNRVEMESLAPVALRALAAGGVLWGCYPKGSSGLQTDLSRDLGWDVLTQAGWQVVTSISLDDTWSASRFRPAER